MKKLKYSGIGLALILVLSGCSANEKGNVLKEQEKAEEQSPTEIEDDNKVEKEETISTSDTTELTVDDKTASEIAQDERIKEAIVQLETIGDKKFVNAHITLSQMMKGEETAQKYAELLKEKYPGRIADMIISMNGTVVFQGSFE